ncbi:MAG TPA: hypothetical protein VLW53_21835 [Candidatus Eisenbacteria bacterium]|nr:hypothetical protein [Candidatus Eisenbacteria bacterium]
MPLSDAARDAVRAMTARNPRAAQRLLDMMRAAPEVARRRPTRFGPLNILILGQPPLPPDEVRLCEGFGEEWLRGDFDVFELADAVEAALRDATGRRQDPRRHQPGGWRTLAGRAQEPDRLLGS